MANINWVRTGWIELHNAAMSFGAEVEYWPDDYPELKGREYLDAVIYKGLLSNIVKYSHIDLDTYGCRADLIRNLIFRYIRVTAKNHQKGVLWKFLTTIDSPNTLIAEFKKSTLFVPDSQAQIFSKIQIQTIAKYGLGLIARETKTRQEFLLVLLWGLAFIGLTKFLWVKQGVCEFCYRRTWPGSRFCDEHSQSQSDIKHRSENYMKYRTGYKAHALIEKHKLTDKVQGSNMFKYGVTATAMSDLLFPKISDEQFQNDEKNMIHHSLSVSPQVLKRFKEKSNKSYAELIELEYDSLINHLRKILDPHELSITAWPNKIIAAEIWFSAEMKVSPGVRETGRKAAARVALAKKLLARGLNKSQIANKLKISPSTISKWLIRKPELVKVFR